MAGTVAAMADAAAAEVASVPLGKRHRRPRPRPPAPVNPPQIDITGAASPVEERPEDYPNRPAVYSTGTGSADMYHYHRAETGNDQRAREMAQVTGPGQP